MIIGSGTLKFEPAGPELSQPTTMNQIISAQLQRIDAALNKLIESISALNPSSAAAVDLVAADDALSTSLDLRACRDLAHLYSH